MGQDKEEKQKVLVHAHPLAASQLSGGTRITGVTQNGRGGDVLLAGLTTYVGVHPGMHLWLAMDWDITRTTRVSHCAA